jgi:hypothetical protein
MSVNAISQANGADLLNLLNQSTGQARTSPAFAASVEVLKKAITQAQSNESQIFAGGIPDSGGQLNVLRVANPALTFCIATRGSGAKDAPEADRGCAGRRKGRPFRFCVDGHPLGYFALARAIRPMHTLVIQLGRLGDVVQTTPLLRELAAAGSGDLGDRIDLLLLHPNQAAVLGIQGIATIRTMGEDLKPLEDQIAPGFRRRQIPGQAAQLLQQLQLPRYDRVINASHAALGCSRTAEISAGQREGGLITRDGECLYEGAAQTYRVAMVEFRERTGSTSSMDGLSRRFS